MSVPLLTLKKISKEFPGVKALDNVDFDLLSGEVHVLLGENGAGKSTLIKVISGVYGKDSGSMQVEGREVNIQSTHESKELGISTIYQEFNLVPNLTVAENIFLGNERVKGKKRTISLMDWKKMFSDARDILEKLDLDIDPKVKVNRLGVAEKQMIEIAKALVIDSKIMIFDEPTAVLTDNEINKLFSIINDLKNEGMGIIYISHRLEEIPQIGNRISILRDGKLVVTLDDANTKTEDLISYMIGRELKSKFHHRDVKIGDELLKVENLSCGGLLKNLSFTLRKGEILGIAGLVGSGRTELAKAIYGAMPIEEGKVYKDGELLNITSPRDAINRRICYLPEERKTEGLNLLMSIKENISLAALDRISNLGFIHRAVENSIVARYINKLNIRTPDADRKVVYLSGGNQQKVVIAKWLCVDADIFIFDEPTRGIDVGAKFEVYQLMSEIVANGAGIIMISSELPEVLGMSDRILVMRKGRITGEFTRDEATQDKILTKAWGQN